jgi:hypothetical protein
MGRTGTNKLAKLDVFSASIDISLAPDAGSAFGRATVAFRRGNGDLHFRLHFQRHQLGGLDYRPISPHDMPAATFDYGDVPWSHFYAGRLDSDVNLDRLHVTEHHLKVMKKVAAAMNHGAGCELQALLEALVKLGTPFDVNFYDRNGQIVQVSSLEYGLGQAKVLGAITAQETMKRLESVLAKLPDQGVQYVENVGRADTVDA